jgi:hypothetical protein
MAFRDFLFLLLISSTLHILQVFGGPVSLSFPALNDHPLLDNSQHSRTISLRHERESVRRNVTGQECDFESIQDFFEYAYEQKLNITAEVQNCQSLCLMTYGKGNPDLSGIGVRLSWDTDELPTTADNL